MKAPEIRNSKLFSQDPGRLTATILNGHRSRVAKVVNLQTRGMQNGNRSSNMASLNKAFENGVRVNHCKGYSHCMFFVTVLDFSYPRILQSIPDM
jgi:hypothetical protein